MKQLLILLMITVCTQSLFAANARVERAKINPSHLNPADYRGGLIKLDNDTITLAIFVKSSNSNEPKQLSFDFAVNEVFTNECGSKFYYSNSEDTNVTLADHSQADACDQVYLFPVELTYTTIEDDGEKVSTFQAFSFQSISNKKEFLKIGLNTPRINQPITIMPASEPTPMTPQFKIKSTNDNPVILPVLDVM